MTEIERLEVARRAVQQQLDNAKQRHTADSLRASFAALQDTSLPIAEIFIEACALHSMMPSAYELAEFAERLACAIHAHRHAGRSAE